MEDEVIFHQKKKVQGVLYQLINLAFFAESESIQLYNSKG